MSILTAALLARARTRENADPVGLVQIDFSVPTARSVYLATRRAELNGKVWQPAIADLGAIRARTRVLSAGPDLADVTIVLDNTKLHFQTAATDTIDDALADFEWQGATITVWRWFPGLSWASIQPAAFVGEIVSFRGDRSTTTIVCQQDASVIERPLPRIQIDRSGYPGAPDGAIGRWAPEIIGAKQAQPLREPMPSAYGLKDEQESCGGGSLVAPGLVVNSGRVGSRVEVLFASHPLETFGDSAAGCSLFLRGDERLSLFDFTGTKTNDATGARLAIDLATMRAWAGAVPMDAVVPPTTADNPLNACDLSSPETFSFLDEPNGKGVLQLALPSLGSLGVFTTCDLVVCYSTMPSLGTFIVRPQNPTGSSIGTAYTLAGTAGLEVPAVAVFAYDTDWWDESNWSFGSLAAPRETIHLRFGFNTPGATNKARVFWCAVRPHYQPARNVISPGQTRITRKDSISVTGARIKGKAPAGVSIFGGYTSDVFGEIAENQADFFHNARGMKDDGSGTYSGTPNGLVELVPDVVHMLLRERGGVSAAGVETGAVFGGVTKARELFNTLDGFPIRVGRVFSDKGTVGEALMSLMEETHGFWFLNRFTGRHSLTRWTRDPDVDYDLTIEREHLIEDRLEWERVTERALKSGVEVAYGFDAFQGKHLYRAAVGDGTSSGGFDQFEARDQYLTVVSATNDELEWREEYFPTVTWGGTTGTDTIQVASTASYAPGMAVIDPYPVPSSIPAGTTILSIVDATHLRLSNNLIAGAVYPNAVCSIERRRKATLPALDYTGPSLAVQTRASMAAISTSAPFKVEWGFDVVADFNDRVIVWAGAPYAAQVVLRLTAGSYNGRQLAAHLQALLVAQWPAISWSVTYSNSTRKFTISAGASTVELRWAYYGPSGAETIASSALLFGFDPGANTGAAASLTSAIECRGETFRLARYGGTFSLPIMIPSPGLKTAIGLYGFRRADRTGAALYCADFRRSHRERLAAGTGTVHNQTAPELIASGWLNDTRAATDARDLRFGHRGESPIAIRIATWMAPDIDRGMVLRTGASLDGIRKFPRYGSDGTWAGKRWRVVEVQDSIVANMQEIVAVETTASGALGVSGPPPTPQAQPALVTFSDSRSGWQVYAQKMSGDGTAQWIANGKLLSSNTGSINTPASWCCSDGAGGFFVAWMQGTDTQKDIYVNRLQSDGTVHPSWPAGGRAVCNAAGVHLDPRCIGDGVGNVLVLWEDARAGSLHHVYAQKVDAGGTVQWAANGVALTNGPSYGNSIGDVTSDGAGGALVSIYAQDFVGGWRIKAARITGAGSASWGADGVTIVTAVLMSGARHCTDGAGGMYIAWQRGSTLNVTRLTSTGAYASGWTSAGVNVASATTTVGAWRVVADGSGGVVVSWCDVRGATVHEVYGQRLNASGTIQWATGGVVLMAGGQNASGYSYTELRMLPDGIGGGVLVAAGTRPASIAKDLYAQRFNGAGSPQWGALGATLVSATGDQADPRMGEDGLGGWWVSWRDSRGAQPAGYVARIASDGTIALAGTLVASSAGTQSNIRMHL